MRISADTNVLLRTILDDDPVQSPRARTVMRQAESMAVAIATPCEFMWVLRRNERRSRSEVVLALRVLTQQRRVAMDREAVEAGIQLLEAGGDFTDAVGAYEGKKLGATVFVTFDGDAAELLARSGIETHLLT